MTIRIALLCAAFLTSVACSSSGDAGSTGDTGAAAVGTPAPSAQADAQLAPLTEFRLTRDKLDRYYAAEKNMYDELEKMTPAERQRLKETLEPKEDSSATIEDAARVYDSHPATAAAFRAAGISSRDFVATMMALLQSGMGQYYLENQPKANADSLARELGTHPDNFRFLRENRAEIERRQKESQARQRQVFGSGE